MKNWEINLLLRTVKQYISLPGGTGQTAVSSRRNRGLYTYHDRLTTCKSACNDNFCKKMQFIFKSNAILRNTTIFKKWYSPFCWILDDNVVPSSESLSLLHIASIHTSIKRSNIFNFLSESCPMFLSSIRSIDISRGDFYKRDVAWDNIKIFFHSL